MLEKRLSNVVRFRHAFRWSSILPLRSSSGLTLLSSSGLTGRSRKNANAYDHLYSLVKPGNDRIAAFEALTHLQISNKIRS